MGEVIAFTASRALYADRTSDLDGADCVLLLALRSWVQSCRNGQDPVPLVAQMLALAGAEAAVGPLKALMAVLTHTSEKPLDIRCLRCTRMSGNEKDLLCAASLIQSGEVLLAEKVLRLVLQTSETVPVAIHAMERLCDLLSRVHLFLTWRRPSSTELTINTADQDAWSPFPTLH